MTYDLVQIAIVLGIGLISIVSLVLITHSPYDPFPVLGHVHAFALRSRQYHLQWFLDASLHFKGQTWRLEIPFVGKGWVINDPAALKHVLTNKHSSFGKGEFFESRAKDLFGKGILIAKGESWKVQRAAGHAFTSPALIKHFADVTLHKNLKVLLNPLEAASISSEKNGEIVDFQEIALDYLMAVFGEIAFDADWQRLSTTFSIPFHKASAGISKRFSLPFYWIFEYFLPSGKGLRRDLETARRVSRELVKESLEDIAKEEMGMTVDDDDGDRIENKMGRGMLVRKLIEGGMTDEGELADSCLNFLTAGRDTTAQALTWTLYSLLIHQETNHIPKIINEIRSLSLPLSQTPVQQLPTSLPYLEATISESLRLNPPIPIEILENISSNPITLPDTSQTIVQPGEQVVWCTWAMARLPYFWGSDASTFKPSRWLSSVSDDKCLEGGVKVKPTVYENPVFHAGPRSCVGQPLARLELVFALAHVLIRYEFSLVDNEDNGGSGGKMRVKGVGEGLTAPMAGGLKVRVRKRGVE